MDQIKLQQITRDYEDLFCGKDFSKLSKLALDGHLRHSDLRSLAWKVFLGCLPKEMPHKQWVDVINIHRREYQALLNQYLIDPHSSGKELDPALNNPLSQSEESPWMKFFQNAELQKEIDQDITRTYPENEFFQMNSVREMMRNILFIYARQTPQLSYKQGMHELLAPILYIIHREKMANLSGFSRSNQITTTQDELQILLDENFIEHDAFMLFNHLMGLVKNWFSSNNESTAQKNKESKDTDDSSPIIEKCRFIQNTLLKDRDFQLYLKLSNLHVEPQLYMLRWVRLLLGREFHLEDLFVLWDALFSYDQNLILIDYLCVALLIYIRTYLLSEDYTNCMRRLFKYPPVEDVHTFVEHALILMQQQQSNGQNAPPLYQISSGNQNAPQQKPKKSHWHTDHRLSKAILDPLSHAVKHILHDEHEPENRYVQEIRRLKSNQYHMANRLERIIYSLQKDLIDNAASSAQNKSDVVSLALAELKQIKDILSGLIPADSPPLVHADNNNNHVSKTETQEPEESDPLGVTQAPKG